MMVFQKRGYEQGVPKEVVKKWKASGVAEKHKSSHLHAKRRIEVRKYTKGPQKRMTKPIIRQQGSAVY
jgi:hypothetical protein